MWNNKLVEMAPSRAAGGASQHRDRGICTSTTFVACVVMTAIFLMVLASSTYKTDVASTYISALTLKTDAIGQAAWGSGGIDSSSGSGKEGTHNQNHDKNKDKDKDLGFIDFEKLKLQDLEDLRVDEEEEEEQGGRGQLAGRWNEGKSQPPPDKSTSTSTNVAASADLAKQRAITKHQQQEEQQRRESELADLHHGGGTGGKGQRGQAEAEAAAASHPPRPPPLVLPDFVHIVDKNKDKNKDKNQEKEKERKELAVANGKNSNKGQRKEKQKGKGKGKGNLSLHGEEPVGHTFHPQSSPRKGSDIEDPDEQYRLLNCPNQSECIIPELQLQEKSRVYLCIHPARHGVRFYFLVHEGLKLHPNVEIMSDYNLALKDASEGGAHYVIYLPGSSPWHKTECTNASLANKLIVMDEFDGHNLFFPYKSSDEVVAVYGPDMVWYSMYFKRSFVARRDGKFLTHPHLDKADVYPLTYAIAEAYVPHSFTFKREIELLCTLRGHARMPTRLRVSTWVQEYSITRRLKTAAVGQIDKSQRNIISKDYFEQMYNSQIIVTVNPSNWEGDFRLWESFATGALIFVDPVFTPHPHSMIDGVHCVFYHNSNRTELFEKLDYYRSHPDIAHRIAITGYLHAMKYHRTVNLIDYVLRSAHLKQVLLKREQYQLEKQHADTGVQAAALALPAVPEYTFTAQYLNHQVSGLLPSK